MDGCNLGLFPEQDSDFCGMNVLPGLHAGSFVLSLIPKVIKLTMGNLTIPRVDRREPVFLIATRNPEVFSTCHE